MKFAGETTISLPRIEAVDAVDLTVGMAFPNEKAIVGLCIKEAHCAAERPGIRSEVQGMEFKRCKESR